MMQDLPLAPVQLESIFPFNRTDSINHPAGRWNQTLRLALQILEQLLKA
jgi:hypothetical protein